jgi:hypothetical protein
MDHAGLPNFRFRMFDPPAEVGPERNRGRAALLQQVEPENSPRLSPGSGESKFRKFQEKAFQLVNGAEGRRAFDLTLEAPSVRDRYGRNALGQNLLLSRRLIEAGVRLVTVLGWAGSPQGDIQNGNLQTWDMHSVVYAPDDTIYGTGYFGLGFALPRLDRAVAALLDDLENRGLLSSTLVVLVGEFGRTPRLITNAGHGVGRDHHSACYSAFLAGGSIHGGAVYGASDKNGAFVKDRPVSPEDFAATLLHGLGVPPDTRLSAYDDFPRVASTGRPITELFG